jgi:hypothetical protein
MEAKNRQQVTFCLSDNRLNAFRLKGSPQSLVPDISPFATNNLVTFPGLDKLTSRFLLRFVIP